MLQDIHEALFEVPPGSGPDEKPLIEALRVMWTAYQRTSWAGRSVIWVVLTVGALTGAISAIWSAWGDKQ